MVTLKSVFNVEKTLKYSGEKGHQNWEVTLRVLGRRVGVERKEILCAIPVTLV